MEKKNGNQGLVIGLLFLAAVIAFSPLFLMKGAEFGGSDDKGNSLIEMTDPDYEPWATPVLEILLGGELPGEVESMLFCLQTGIGVGVIAFFMGRFVERKKWMKDDGSGDA